MAMAQAAQRGAPRAEERRRRVGALLNAYYRIEGAENEEQNSNGAESDLDRQGFEAKKYFDNMVASGKIPELIRGKNQLDDEVQNLDKEKQTLVYENYCKFVRATDIIKQMKNTIEILDPDLNVLEGNVQRINEHQHKAENVVSGRAGRIDLLLKQQRNCKKLQVLFSLPSVLQGCLDKGAYGRAVEAYCNCAGFLRQYRHMETFQKVLEEVEHQMSRIRSALEERLRSSELSNAEAVNSSVTLLDLGEDQGRVAREYLSGRTGVLQQSLECCFVGEPVPSSAQNEENADGETEQPAAELSRDQRDLQRPESVALHGACTRVTELYVPHLCDAVEGFQKLQEGRQSARQGPQDDAALTEFVTTCVQELCERIGLLVDHKCPPTRVLVSCIHLVRDALRRLHCMLPRLLTRLFMAFLCRTANNAMKALFANAASSLVKDLCGLHGECKRLQETKNSGAGLDDVLEEIAKTEQSLIMHGFTALSDCQPLLSLLGTDRQACQQFVQGLHGQLITLFLAFVEVCHVYVGHAATEAHNLDPSLPVVPRVALEELEEASQLDWSGLFGLALVRIGRHLEVKAINKIWGVAKDLFVGGESGGVDLQPHPAVIKAARGAAQAVISHYVMASGQRLAHFFRNSVQSRNWMTVREPRDPRLVVEIVLKELYAFDAQLAKILGDPRKPRENQRRTLSRVKNSMELEMERLWAKKLQVFAQIPFNRNGAVVGILRVAFKALYEYMREETFGTYGLQQIQVDCAFLSTTVPDFVEAEDASVLDSLLDEVVTSASQRCIEPVLMDPVIVETLCDEKKKGFRFE